MLLKLVTVCAALNLAGCALAPEYKTFHFSREDWTGPALSSRGEITASDAVAGAAPNTTTVLEIGSLGTAPLEREARTRVQSARARALTEALERRGVAPKKIAVEWKAAYAPEPFPPPASKPMVVIVYY